ncbi:MAG TPA: hypothetical protein VNH17_03140 [Streptosporangiaceae bacterium]|nr:hypothetical protein [Streptosporangiaceae bacterium]
MLPAPDSPATRSADPAHAPSAVRAAGRGRATTLAALVRTHWLITVLLAAGLVLRLLTVFAYRPALLYVDTFKYLLGEYPGSDPLGYRLILKVILVAGNLQLVAIIQHLLGLAIAVTLYVLLLRRGAPRWLAALAAGPVLLDAYQLQIEHMIMPDVWFEALVVAGLAVLLWRPAVTVPAAAAAGLVLGSSATVKQAGELLILPVAVFLLLAVRGWGRALATSGVTIAAFVLPILGYCTVSLIQTGHFWLSAGQPNSGRMAYAADCATLQLPPAVRPLCPSPAAQANGPDWLEHSGQSPLRTAPIPPGANRKALIDQLTSAVLHQQPLRVAGSALRDSVRLFALTRDGVQSVTPIERWQFQPGFPQYPPWVSTGPNNEIIVGVQHVTFGPFDKSVLNPAYGGPAQVNHGLAMFLRRYQIHGGYTPGPLFLLLTLTALAGSAAALTRRRTGRLLPTAQACFLLTASAATLLLIPDFLQFSWRYQLPALITLVPGGALGITVILSWRSRREAPARQEAPADPQGPAAPDPAAS